MREREGGRDRLRKRLYKEQLMQGEGGEGKGGGGGGREPEGINEHMLNAVNGLGWGWVRRGEGRGYFSLACSPQH